MESVEDPVARKQRLKALKKAAEAAQLQQQQQQQPAAPPAEQQPPEQPVLKFRNYQVRDQKRIEHEQVCWRACALVIGILVVLAWGFACA